MYSFWSIPDYQQQSFLRSTPILPPLNHNVEINTPVDKGPEGGAVLPPAVQENLAEAEVETDGDNLVADQHSLDSHPKSGDPPSRPN